MLINTLIVNMSTLIATDLIFWITKFKFYNRADVVCGWNIILFSKFVIGEEAQDEQPN